MSIALILAIVADAVQGFLPAATSQPDLFKRTRQERRLNILSAA